MAVLTTDKIAGWSVTTLTKFLEDWFRNHPLPAIGQLQIDTLAVTQDLDIQGKVSFDTLKTHVVGSSGEPAYTNGWTFYGAPYAKAAFVKTPDGWVRLLGVIAGGTVGSPAFTLPPGFRPDVTVGPLSVMSAGTLGRVDIGSDGTVTPQLPSANTSVVLDNICFQAS